MLPVPHCKHGRAYTPRLPGPKLFRDLTHFKFLVFFLFASIQLPAGVEVHVKMTGVGVILIGVLTASGLGRSGPFPLPSTSDLRAKVPETVGPVVLGCGRRWSCPVESSPGAQYSAVGPVRRGPLDFLLG